jgi:hypothetical protein
VKYHDIPPGNASSPSRKAKVYQLALRLSRKPALIAMIEKCQFSANKTAVKVPIVPINGTFRCSSMNLGAYNPNICRACIHAVLQQFQSGDPNGFEPDMQAVCDCAKMDIKRPE